MDNKTILMVIVAIVLGMLVANMFKEVCGCKNLIEGQCTGGGQSDCKWNRLGRGAGGRNYSCNIPSAGDDTATLNQLCSLPTAAGTVRVGGATRRDPQDYGAQDGQYWWNTPCCTNQPDLSTDPAGGSPVTISDEGCITGGGAIDSLAASRPTPMVFNEARLLAKPAGNFGQDFTCEDLSVTTGQDGTHAYDCADYTTCPEAETAVDRPHHYFCSTCCTAGATAVAESGNCPAPAFPNACPDIDFPNDWSCNPEGPFDPASSPPNLDAPSLDSDRYCMDPQAAPGAANPDRSYFQYIFDDGRTRAYRCGESEDEVAGKCRIYCSSQRDDFDSSITMNNLCSQCCVQGSSGGSGH